MVFIMSMTSRKGVIQKIDNNVSLMQTASIHGTSGEFSTKVERYQNYGFSSFPMPIDETTGHGAEVILTDTGGSSLKTIVATDDRRFRPIAATEGDVSLYTHKDLQTANAASALHRLTLKTRPDDTYSIISKCNETLIRQDDDGGKISDGSREAEGSV